MERIQKSLLGFTDKKEEDIKINDIKISGNEKPFPWLGGKTRSLKVILKNIPQRLHNYLEPFFGGGSIFLNLNNAGINVKTTCVLNDLNADLINLWKCLYDPEKSKQMKEILKTMSLYHEDLFSFAKELLESSSDINKALAFLLKIHLSFGGMGQSFNKGYGKGSHKYRMIYQINEVWDKFHNYIVSMNAHFLNRDFKRVLGDESARLNSNFFYIDPPYHNLHHYVKYEFKDEDFKDLKGLLEDLKTPFILSLNSDEFTRSLFSEFEIKEFGVKYSINKDENGKEYKELLISNYKLKD